jgi:hypothetical protein
MVFESVIWDGFKLLINYAQVSGGHITDCDRNDLIEYLPELNYQGQEEIGGIKEEEFLDKDIYD